MVPSIHSNSPLKTKFPPFSDVIEQHCGFFRTFQSNLPKLFSTTTPVSSLNFFLSWLLTHSFSQYIFFLPLLFIFVSFRFSSLSFSLIIICLRLHLTSLYLHSQTSLTYRHEKKKSIRVLTQPLCRADYLQDSLHFILRWPAVVSAAGPSKLPVRRVLSVQTSTTKSPEHPRTRPHIHPQTHTSTPHPRS
jgi:hypothetical protein